MSINTLQNIIVGTWFVLGLSIVAVFCFYLLKGRGLVSRNSYSAATSLAVYFLGEAITRGSFLAFRFLHTPLIWYSMLAGSVIAAIGALCIVRVFSTAYWSNWAWIIVGLIAIGAAFAFSAI